MRLEAAGRSSFDAMMNFYKANWPHAPYSLEMPAIGGRLADYPKVKAPTLVVSTQGSLDMTGGIDGTAEGARGARKHGEFFARR